jgi:hypothetical protein
MKKIDLWMERIGNYENREFWKEYLTTLKPQWERRDELENEDLEKEFQTWKRNKVIENILKDDEKRIS